MVNGTRKSVSFKPLIDLISHIRLKCHNSSAGQLALPSQPAPKEEKHIHQRNHTETDEPKNREPPLRAALVLAQLPILETRNALMRDTYLRFSNRATPAWHIAAAIKKLGMRNAATALPATFG